MEKHDHFYRAFPSFLKYVLANGGKREDAEDAYGQALYWVVKAANHGTVITDWDAYIFIAARHEYIKMEEKGKNLSLLSMDEESQAVQQKVDPAAKADASLDTQIIEGCINHLRQLFKDVLTSTVEGYSDKEIEARFNLAANSAKVTRNHARRELKRLLGDAGWAFSLFLMSLLSLLK